MRFFCTYFDRTYLSRGLALHESLLRHCPSSRLWVLCMDDATHEILTRLSPPHLHPIALADFERGDTELLKAKPSRSRIEYYFTCSPSLPLYVLNHHAEVDLITYLDSDLFFFASPEPVFAEMSDRSIAIIEHRYTPHLRHLLPNGIFNVSWLSFRRDERGLACLGWWRERCLEWCYDRVEPTRFADQKYLDTWPAQFEGVVVLQHKGANLAPWNLLNYSLRAGEEGIGVDDQELVFYHFQGLKPFGQASWELGLSGYGVRPTRFLKQQIYGPYLRVLAEKERLVSKSRADNEAMPTRRRRNLRDVARILLRGDHLPARCQT